MGTILTTIFPSSSPATRKPTPNVTPVSVSTSNFAETFLRSCSNVKDFSPLQAHLTTTNFIHDPEINKHVLRFLISIDKLDYAFQVCSYVNEPETVIWNILVQSQLKEGCPNEVLTTYYNMVTEGALLDRSTFHYLIRACSRPFDVRQGSEVHGRILKSGFGFNKSLNNNLMSMYAKCGKLEEVCCLFRKLNYKDVISWNTMISCYVSMGMYRKALNCFDEMKISGLAPDEITMISLVSACTKLQDLATGERLYIYIAENAIEVGGNLLNCLVDMYVKCGKLEEANRLLDGCKELETDVITWTTLISGYVKSNKINEARCLFDQMSEKNLISWTTMMSGYVRGGFYLECLELFRQMRLENVSLDEVALVTALSACAHMEDGELGRAIHGLVVRCYGGKVDGFLGNALVDLYAKCKKLDKACRMFKQLPCKSVVSWNSMLDGFCRSSDVEKTRNFFDNIPEKDIVTWNTMVNFYGRHDLLAESFQLFLEMQSSGVKPDKITLISLLSSCAKVGALNHGLWIHVYIKKNEIGVDTKLGTSLIDMYGKCGCTELAFELFSEMTEKNVHVWTAMIAAYAMEGQARKAIDLYWEMEETGINPDCATFVALLSACSHEGLVDEGYHYFNKMSTFYKLRPKIQHYGCMVDLLGRVGRLDEAVKFIERMPMKPDVSIWSSLMRASGSHHNIELAEYAFKRLTEIDSKNDGAYVLLSNIYAKASRWDDASRMRTRLHDMGVRKQPGFSLVENNGVVQRFSAGDFSGSRSAEVYSMIEEIERRFLKRKSPDASSQHSERLAVAFSLISNNGRSTIRVVNNVRICVDCHSLMKLISLHFDTEIAIRDNYRFHKFKDGFCSCKDHW